jgi:molybdopterin converting factor small subunit
VATVYLPSGLAAYTGGVETIDIDASRVVDLMTELAARYPDLAPQLDEMAVAIDGEIYQQPGYQPLSPRSEVHLVPRIAGG